MRKLSTLSLAVILVLILAVVGSVAADDVKDGKDDGAQGVFVPRDLAHCSTNTDPIDIPDNDPGGMTNDITLLDGGAINDLDISLNITHTWVGDLIVSVENVDTGTSAVIFDRPGYVDTGFGCSDNDIVDGLADDDMPDIADIENHCPGDGLPWLDTESFAPMDALSVFDGEDSAATWRISISDNAGGDTGALVQWCVEATTDATAVSLSDAGVATFSPTALLTLLALTLVGMTAVTLRHRRDIG